MEYPVLAQKVLAEVGDRSPRTQWAPLRSATTVCISSVLTDRILCD
jgi:hypothetical protein